MVPETLDYLFNQLFGLTAEEAQVFLDVNYPEHFITVDEDGSAEVSGPELNFTITTHGDIQDASDDL